MRLKDVDLKPGHCVAIGLAFMAAIGSANDWLRGQDTPPPPAFPDNFICGVDTYNAVRKAEYTAIAQSMQAEAEAIRARFLRTDDREAVRAMLQAMNPSQLGEDAETGALTAKWGYDNPQDPAEIVLDREGEPAYLEIDVKKHSYVAMSMRNGTLTPQGGASYVEVTLDEMNQQWSTGSGLDNPDGPAFRTLSNADHTLSLGWYAQDAPAFIGGHPTAIQMDVDTQIVFREDYGAFGGANRRQIHGPNHLHVLERDRKTGRVDYLFYNFHGRRLEDPDPTREIWFDPQTGAVQKETWRLNGKETPAPPNRPPMPYFR